MKDLMEHDDLDLDDGDDALLRDLRAMPQPPAPPTLGRDIAAAIDREEERARSPWVRVRAWLTRPVVGLTVAAATAGGLGLWVATRSRPALDQTETATTSPTPPAPAPAPAPPAPAPVQLFENAPVTAGGVADLDALDDKALDRLGADLQEDLVGDTTAADEEILPQPDLEWVDELSSEEVDSLDQYLAAHPHRSHT